MGSGRLETSLKTLASELGVSSAVRFLGQVPGGRCYFKAFDLFALTSDHEPFGMVLLEAMAAGVPVIGTNCGGAPEVIGDAAHLFDQLMPGALANLLANQTGLSREALEAQAALQLEKLRTMFSDEAVGMQFWRYLKKMGEGTRCRE